MSNNRDNTPPGAPVGNQSLELATRHANTNHHGNGRKMAPSSANSSTRLTSISGVLALQYQHSSSPVSSDTDSELGSDDDITTDYVTSPNRPPRHPKKSAKSMDTPSQGHVVIELTEEQEVKQRRAGNLVFSCFVFWCCNSFFGAAAFFVALSTRDAKAREARRLGSMSLSLNVAGIAISWIIVGVVVGMWWFGVINIPFAPWRIQHFYGDDSSSTMLPNTT